jgi:hypothetical protein
MLPLLRDADRGPRAGRFVKVYCAACHHVALLTRRRCRGPGGDLAAITDRDHAEHRSRGLELGFAANRAAPIL